MKRFAIGLVLVTACSTPALEDEPLGETRSNIQMPACGSKLNEIDGVWAYSNGWAEGTGDSCAGQSAQGTLLYQCVEYAQRYFNQRFGTTPVWNVQYAAQMCNNNPAGTTVHWAGSGYTPKRGDAIVWQTGYWGHVAVVKSNSSGTMTIVEQNGAWSTSGTRTLYASNGYNGAACFVSGNNAVAGGGAGAKCGYGDGLYCGGNGGGSDTNTLYRCTGGTPVAEKRCAQGCEKMPAGQNDRCKNGSGVSPDEEEQPKPAGASCPSGYGLYCGGNGVTGDAKTLYDCQPTGLTVAQRCAGSCVRMASGFNDKCN